MRRRGFTIWELAVRLVGIAIIFVIFLPAILRPSPREVSYCQSNLKQVGLGILQYSQDADEKYPPVNFNDAAISEINPLGWGDALYPYLKSHQIFWCPAQEKNGVRHNSEKQPSDRDYTDYFLNRRLAGIEITKLSYSAFTIMCGEGNDGTDAANARYSLSTLPPAWITNIESPLHRHLEGSNFLFADGHVKWYKPNAITNKKPDADNPTFAIK